MIVAIPITGDKISPTLDFSVTFLLVTIDGGKIIERTETQLTETILPLKVARLVGMRVDTVICNAVSNPFSSMLMHAGVELYSWIDGEVEEALRLFIGGKLSAARSMLPAARGFGVGQGRGGEGRGRGGGGGRGKGGGRGRGGQGGGRGRGGNNSGFFLT